MKVKPTGLLANGFWNIFTGKKKYTITCGNCNFSYIDKVIFSMGDTANSICPSCNSVNIWSHTEFQEYYNTTLEIK